MVNLVFKQLLLDKTKTSLTLLAVAAVVSVILILKGFEQGQYHQLEQLVLNRNADLIVTQNGVKNFIATRSVIPQTIREGVEAVPGVVEAHPITALPIIYSKAGVRTPIYVIVFDTLGGPSKLIAGESKQFGSHIVIDHSLARKYQLQVGDDFVVSDFTFTISGISQEAAFMMPFAFINYDGMIDLFLESEIAPDLSTFPLLSYLLVELKPDYDQGSVIRTIEQKLPEVDVFRASEIADNDVKLGQSFFRPIMGVLVSVGYIIGLLVISLIMFSETNSNQKSFAMLKALGFRFSSLINYLLFLSLLILVVAFPVAVGLASLIGWLIEFQSPVYLIKVIDFAVILQTAVASLSFSLLGGMIPMIRIKYCDSMLVFEAN